MREPQEVLAKLDKTSSCWLWTGYTDPCGYGRVHWRGRNGTLVHRLVYELLVGPIPPGMTIDHVKTRGCTSPACANPAHLEPVTMAMNNRRARGVGVINAEKTHCVNGHELTPDNVYVQNTGKRRRRRCRTCQIAANRRQRQKAS